MTKEKENVATFDGSEVLSFIGDMFTPMSATELTETRDLLKDFFIEWVQNNRDLNDADFRKGKNLYWLLDKIIKLTYSGQKETVMSDENQEHIQAIAELAKIITDIKKR